MGDTIETKTVEALEARLRKEMGNAAAAEEPKAELVRFEEADDGGMAPFDFVKEEGDILKSAMTMAQRELISLDIPLETTGVVEVGNGKYAAYLPVGFYIDTLNKLTLWNWALEIDERRLDQREVSVWNNDTRQKEKVIREELMVSGHLVIFIGPGGGRQIRIPCEGGAIVRNNANMTYADFYKIARADMIKTGATVLGIGLGLKDPRRREEALVYHGRAVGPEFRELQNLKTACGAKDNDGIVKKLVKMGIPAQEWELKSMARVEALTAAAKRVTG